MRQPRGNESLHDKIASAAQSEAAGHESADESGRIESAKIADPDFDKDARRRQHKRDEDNKDLQHKVARYFFLLLAAVITLFILVVVFHMATPYAFLSQEQLGEIKSILVGVISTSLLTFLHKHFN